MSNKLWLNKLINSNDRHKTLDIHSYPGWGRFFLLANKIILYLKHGMIPVRYLRWMTRGMWYKIYKIISKRVWQRCFIWQNTQPLMTGTRFGRLGIKAIESTAIEQAVYSETEQRVEVMQRQRDDERRQCRGGTEKKTGWLKYREHTPKNWLKFSGSWWVFDMILIGLCWMFADYLFVCDCDLPTMCG